MINIFLVIFGKLLSGLFRLLNLGNGSTWPGHIALKANKHFIHDILSKSEIKTILIAGTNGKTTTSKLVLTGLEKNGKTVIQNQSGANLLNGIASTLIQKSNNKGEIKQDFAIFEIDENALPLILKEIVPDYLILLNLFRDQLDRYGEVNTIVDNWKKSIQKLPKETNLILNADDPQIAYLAKSTNAKVEFFGLQNSQFNNKSQHAADSAHCPKCGEKLVFDGMAFSHLGNWHCTKCGLKRPEVVSEKFSIYPLPGLYNKYNVLAASTLLKQTGLTTEQITHSFIDFKPAFGRQEIVEYKNRKIQVFLSKNPTSFNESYTTIQELGGPAPRSPKDEVGKTLLLILNDRIPDGRDVSWIWDVDLADINRFKNIIISGDRVYDMALRLKYELGSMKNEVGIKTYEDLRQAIDEGVKLIDESETLFILPTYSAMLEVRQILTGKKIL